MRFFALIFCLHVCSQDIELFIDWQPHAKGQELFDVGENQESASILGRLRYSLQKTGKEIRSWEYEAYLPCLMTWKQVHSFSDFLSWIRCVYKPSNPVPKSSSCWIFWGLGAKASDLALNRAPKEKMILFAWEPPVVQPACHDPKIHRVFSRIYTWNDDLVDNIRYFKFYYPVLQPRLLKVPSFEEKKFCTLINSRLSSKHPDELYSEREKIIRFFENTNHEFDLYGRFWEKRKFKNYRGTIANKLETLKNYKFCICYENTKNIKGYVTEKIFDCFAAGVVPVYWGADNICNYVPSDCFIDRRNFKNDEELIFYLRSITKEAYESYLQKAEEFLSSDQAKFFSVEHFLTTMLNACTNNAVD